MMTQKSRQRLEDIIIGTIAIVLTILVFYSLSKLTY